MDEILSMIDVAMLTLKNDKLHVVLLKRDNEPFAGTMALPGGRILVNEDIDARAAALRVLKTKTGIESPYLEQLETFAGATRDPRRWSISIAYYALVPLEIIDSVNHPDVKLYEVDRLRSLPFDHNQIVEKAVARLRSKSQYSSLPCHLVGEQFTLPQLQKVYEALMGAPLNKVSFRRKITEMDMLTEVKGKMEEGTAHRPGQYYKLKASYRDRLKLLERGL